MPLIYQGDVMTSLSYLLGERTVPSTGTEGRKDFIQKTLEEVYNNYPWPFAIGLATLSVTASGIASLPSDYAPNQESFISYNTSSGTAMDLELVDDGDQDAVNIGDNKYWLTSYTGDGQYILNTKEVISSVVVRYQKLPPTLAASVGTPFKNAMTLALGAVRYHRKSQDPEADIGQDQALFDRALQDDVRGIQMSAPRKRRKTAQSIAGSATGEI